MRTAMCACASCALPLEGVVRWGRLLSGEPEVVECNGERFEFGPPEIHVRCPRCGEATCVPRDLPLAVA